MDVIDPIAFTQHFWPDVYLYDKQRAILYSLMDNDETYVPAGNELGKDFVAGIAVWWYFLTRNPCRIVTTSATDKHLNVLWSEVMNRLRTSAYPLSVEQGGTIIVNQRELRKNHCAMSYVIGMVASDATMEAMQGHHVTPATLAEANDGIPRNMFISDESSAVAQGFYDMASTWAKRMFIFGNPWDCTNYFKYAVKGNPGTTDKGGDIPRPDGPGFIRKVIKITAMDSPNVKLGLEQKRLGLPITNEVIVPGVKTYAQYVKHRLLWNRVKQCVSLDAEFYEGAENKLYPPDWLNRAELIALSLSGKSRRARAIGVDPAEGGDRTAMCAVDELGIIELVSKQTPNTAVITGELLAFAYKHGCPLENCLFDQGGGGKEHADRLRDQGHPVRTVAFGEAATLVNEERLRRGIAYRGTEKKIDEAETKYAYKNRRAEMYGILRQLLDPINEGWGIPREYAELRRQLAAIPLWHDNEGRLILPPKHRNPGQKAIDGKPTMHDLIGCSPDEADSLVLAVFGMCNAPTIVHAGAAW